ncbi:hypothetical protein N0V90_003113 [Kalmusia sp. IMI 367209]|nr:hypothetical protein N0V90_003113 [Kalmusia sp. IMI 367209]
MFTFKVAGSNIQFVRRYERHPSKSPRKYWTPVFSKNKALIEKPFIRTREEEFQADGNSLEVFVRDYDDSTPDVAREVILDFCNNLSQKRTVGKVSPKVWFDIRYLPASGTNGLQEYTRWLSPTQLCYEMHQRLLLKPPEMFRQLIWILKESHTAIVVVGPGHFKWAAYAFTDRDEFDSNEDDNTEDEHDNDGINDEDEDDGRDDDSPEENFDMIASDGNLKLDANTPTGDPRIYFLRVAEGQVKTIAREWKYLVHKKAKQRLLSRDRKDSQPLREALQWTVNAIELLNDLRERLSASVQAGKNFSAADGDKQYFADIKDKKGTTALNGIREQFLMLIELNRKLSFLDKDCKKAAKIITLEMSQESNQVNHDNFQLSKEAQEFYHKSHVISVDTNRVSKANNFNAALMLSITNVSTPVVMVMAFFSIEAPIFGLQKNGVTFVLLLISLILILKVVNIATFLMRKHIQPDRIITCLALGQLDRLLDAEKGNGTF